MVKSISLNNGFNSAITPTQERELKALGLNNNSNIKTSADAKTAIAKAQEATTDKTANLSGKPDGDFDDINDTVQISTKAQSLSNRSTF